MMSDDDAREHIRTFEWMDWNNEPPAVDLDDPDSLRAALTWAKQTKTAVDHELFVLRQDRGVDEDALTLAQADQRGIATYETALRVVLHHWKNADLQALSAWTQGLPIVVWGEPDPIEAEHSRSQE